MLLATRLLVLDHSPVRNVFSFWNYDDSVTDVAPFIVLIDAVPGMNDHIFTNACVFIDDRLVNLSVLSNEKGGLGDLTFTAHLLLIVTVRPHDNGFSDLTAGFNHRANADDGSLDKRLGNNTTVRK